MRGRDRRLAVSTITYHFARQTQHVRLSSYSMVRLPQTRSRQSNKAVLTGIPSISQQTNIDFSMTVSGMGGSTHMARRPLHSDMYVCPAYAHVHRHILIPTPPTVGSLRLASPRKRIVPLQASRAVWCNSFLSGSVPRQPRRCQATHLMPSNKIPAAPAHCLARVDASSRTNHPRRRSERGVPTIAAAGA